MILPVQLFDRATELGLRLERRGDMLAVIPARRCPPEFADELRHYKRELLDLIEARDASLPADCAPWLHIAVQVLAGEFDGADRSTVASLSIGLRNIPHLSCKLALARLRPSSSKSAQP